MLHRPSEGTRLCGPLSSLENPSVLRYPRQDDVRHPPNHDGMRVCLRLGDGETSEWRDITQGLRQGCVFFPGLFNIFFAVLLAVTFDRFSINKAVEQEYICIAEGDGKIKDKLSEFRRGTLTPRTLALPRGLKPVKDYGHCCRSQCGTLLRRVRENSNQGAIHVNGQAHGRRSSSEI